MTDESDGSADEHPLEGTDDGAGCAEIWERLSQRRRKTEEGDG